MINRMASVYRDSSRDGFRAQVLVRGVLRKLWLGPVTKTQAEAVADHLERLKRAHDTGTTPPGETVRWARAVSPRIRAQLAKWGLIAADDPKIPRSLGPFVDWYTAEQAYTARSTVARWANVRRRLLEQWPEAWPLTSITPGDCDRFAAQVRRGAKSSHAGKILADVRQLFRAAERHKLIDSNPMADVDCSQRHDRGRESYITPDTAQRLIDAADPQLAAVIALARFGGLRVPSEPLDLEISHVDWESSRIAIPGHKTAARQIPLFPELVAPLRRLIEIAPDGTQWLIHQSRASANKTLRKLMLRLISTTAGVEPWPKLWQNLRASCRTDLEERFPAFVVDAWLGHSSAVGRKHYTRVNDSHFARALGGVVGGVSQPTPDDRQRQPAEEPPIETP